MKLSQ
ncbi:unnamed protein product, partial [Rotaria sp. Silwood1]